MLDQLDTSSCYIPSRLHRATETPMLLVALAAGPVEDIRAMDRASTTDNTRSTRLRTHMHQARTSTHCRHTRVRSRRTRTAHMLIAHRHTRAR
jgi:hypothetical protein